MFVPKTDKINSIANSHVETVNQLETLLLSTTRVYIDYANVRPWSTKLGWHVDNKRLKQFLDSFTTIDAVNYYTGTLLEDESSQQEIKDLENLRYIVRTKPVKVMRFSIDASSIPKDSTALLNQFIKRSLIRKLDISAVEYLNTQFAKMNLLGEYLIEDRKCNFDVEIGIDMLLDAERTNAETFILWSGDSDFADPIDKLLASGKKVILFATAGRVARELSELREKGLFIYDIQKIRDFICWSKEIKSKKDPD